MTLTAETLMLAGGVAAFLLTVYWVRSRDLREKYALGWLTLASILLVLGIFPDLIKGFAERAHLSYPAAVLFVALTLIYVFSFTVSVSLSHQYRKTTRLMQELAILKERVRELEGRLAGAAARSAADPDEARSARADPVSTPD